MPVGLTGGFDLVFGISARTFGALVEGMLRPMIFGLGPPIAVPGGALTFDDLRVEAWFGTLAGNNVEIRIGMHNAAIGGAVNASFGPGWSDFFTPALISAAVVAGGGTDLLLTLNFAATTFDADNEAPLTAAGLTEAQIATFLGPAFALGGGTNPVSLTNGSPMTIVPLAPAVAPGAPLGVAQLAVAVQRRATPATAGEEAVAILLKFQNRPNTPAGAALGNPAAIGPSTFGVGQDLLLEIGNLFLFEVLASQALEAPATLGVPVGSVTTAATGVTLTTPAAITLAGTAGTLTVFTLGAPPAGSTTMPLAVTFTFTADFIAYTVTIAGASITIGLAGTTIVVGTTIPPATVTHVIPWWLVVIRILTGVALGFLAGNIIGAVVGGVVGGLSAFAEAAIVEAIAGPSATGGIAGATGGLGGGFVPAAITGLAGGGALSPPLVFDDLQVGGRSNLPDVVHVLRRVNAIELLSGAMIDLDTGSLSRPIAFRTNDSIRGADLAWDSSGGLDVSTDARVVPMNGGFASIGYADVEAALSGIAASVFGIDKVPLVTEANVQADQLPRGLVLGVRTNRGRLAKVDAWRDAAGSLVLRYLIWDASAAALRIYPAEAPWTVTQTVKGADTPASGDQPVIHHYRDAHKMRVRAMTGRLNGPIAFQWRLAGVTLGPTGSDTIAGASVSWEVSGANFDLHVELGESLDHVELACKATGAGAATATDSIQLTINGRRDQPASPYEAAGERARLAVQEALRRWIEDTSIFVDPNPPDPSPVFRGRVQVAEAQLRAAIRKANVNIDVDKIEIR